MSEISAPPRLDALSCGARSPPESPVSFMKSFSIVPFLATADEQIFLR